MGFCSACGKQLPDEARFCSGCGAPTEAGGSQQQTASRGVASANQEWYTLNEIGSQTPKIVGAIGAALAFVSIFCVWANVRFSLPMMGDMMPNFGSTTTEAHTQLGWLVALLAIGALVALFKRGAGIAVMVMGGLIGAYALLSLILVSSDGGSPGLGIALSLAGGAMLLYSGFTAVRTDKA